MARLLFVSYCLIGVLCFGCSKKGQPNPRNSNTVKIELVSGNNQADTIGYHLSNFITVKVTKNGSPVNGNLVLFQGSGCNSDRMAEFDTGADGTLGYNWYLSGEVGQQTLKIFALDLNGKKLDSVTAISTGIAPGTGLHYSACVYPFGAPVASFCKLSTGRLFTNLNSGKSYLRYSDDNGISWFSVKSLGNTHNLQYVASSPADEVFVFATDGNYMSADAGQTWTALPVQSFNSDQISYAAYTPKGRLLVTTNQHSLYISLDKGKTWVYSSNGFLPNTLLGSVTEDKDGNLYATSREEENLYKSADVGNNWLTVPKVEQTEFDYDIFIDGNNWFYKARSDTDGGIFISKDNGLTYTLLISMPNVFVKNLSVQSDGNLYFSVLQQGLFKAAGVSNTLVNFGSESIGAVPYIVAKNNNLVFGDPDNSVIQYYHN